LCHGVVEFLVPFILSPDYIFTQGDEQYCAILRECAAQILTSVLDYMTRNLQDSSILKTTLFTCINSMHSSFKDLAAASNDAAKLRIKRVYENSVTAVANLSRVLKPQDVVEIVVPAMVRRIAESPEEYKSFIWLSLGNIGMTFDTEIFKRVIEFVFNGVYSIQEVWK
jgi:hypothetical protein